MNERFLLLSKEYASFSIIKKYKGLEDVLIDAKRLIGTINKNDFVLIDTQLGTYTFLLDFYNQMEGETEIYD